MTKKILSLLLVLTFMTVLAACDDKDATSSDSASSAVSSKAVEAASESSAASASSSASVSGATSGAVSEVKGEVYKGDGYSFTIPAGYQLISDEDGNVMISDGTNILTAEIAENTDGKKTLTQKDVEEQLADEAAAEDVSLGSDVSFKIDNFKNIKVDGKEAVSFYCEVQMMGMKVSSYCAEIINGDKLIQFTLIAGEKDAKILDEVLTSVKIG